MAAFSSQRAFFYAFIVSFLVLIVQCAPAQSEHVHLKHQVRALNSPHIYKRQNVSSFEITEAQKVLNEAVAQQNKYNTYRVENPRRNTYVSRHSSGAKASKRQTSNEPAPPTLNATVLAAAKLVAEANAAAHRKTERCIGNILNLSMLRNSMPRPILPREHLEMRSMEMRQEILIGFRTSLKLAMPQWEMMTLIW